MKTRCLTLLLALVIAPAANAASNPEDLPEVPTPAADAPAFQAHAETREVTWRALPGAFVHDQKEIWLHYPGGLATGHHWLPTLMIAGGTAALIYADPHVARYFRDQKHTQHLDKVNDAFDPMITTGEIIAVPVSLMALGYARHDNYQVDTALECALAYGDSAIVDLALKAITRRQRPSDVEAGGTFTDTFFSSSKSRLKGSGFPSGHSAGAFSVATVVAGRYKNHKWVPPVMYAMATAISLSRISTNAHFTSDVFLGAALGHTVAKYQVLRPQ